MFSGKAKIVLYVATSLFNSGRDLITLLSDPVLQTFDSWPPAGDFSFNGFFLTPAEKLGSFLGIMRKTVCRF